MPIERLYFDVNGQPFPLVSVQRSEALGGRLHWQLVGNAQLHKLIAGLRPANSPVDPWPKLSASLQIKLLGTDDEVSVSGVFRVTECSEAPHGHCTVKLEQTVELLSALQPQRYAGAICGEFSSWIKSSPLNSLLSTNDHLDDLNSLHSKDSVVLLVDQSALELASWLAWAATWAGPGSQPYDPNKMLPFWIVGDAGSTWRLVRDAAGKAIADHSTPEWRFVRTRAVGQLECCPYLESGMLLSEYHYTQSLTRESLVARLNGQYLPRRVSFGGDHRWVVVRHDLWNSYGESWTVKLELSEKAPLPKWKAPSFEPYGYLVGEVSRSWESGVCVQCQIAGCKHEFPTRLTTFDAGDSQVPGWQWVPTIKNVVRIDPDWSLSGKPSLAYSFRHNAHSEPYAAEIPNNKSWLVKVGDLAMRFLHRGFRLG